MNETQQLSDQIPDYLPCLLLPIADRNLLLPTVSVAEMVPYNLPSRGGRGPEWYLGEVHWRNTMVPLISYEVINGGSNPGIAPRSRIAVLNATGISDQLPFIGILTQGIPRLAQVENAHIRELTDVLGNAYDLMNVAIAAEEATIPNIEALELAFLNLDLD
ncbi:chemotaxis protein CheW [Halioxenophilus sp. WMMB6]|uniref:chemotaxis protein CheW n=1 Tax=Halioxenophilus sp. WMMB6 TaxID=3073815 RepID=UPI00295EDE9D|nr:chemotaxis protein CheW [Halioxenophilus sp. WMMB6]